jgi:hypothetical protein
VDIPPGVSPFSVYIKLTAFYDPFQLLSTVWTVNRFEDISWGKGKSPTCLAVGELSSVTRNAGYPFTGHFRAFGIWRDERLFVVHAHRCMTTDTKIPECSVALL